MIIGLGYKMRHGKDTVARYIAENYDNFVIDHFAADVYRQVSEPRKKNGKPVPLIRYAFEKKLWFIWDEDRDDYAVFNADDSAVDMSLLAHPLLCDGLGATSLRFQCYMITYFKMEGKDRNVLQWWGTQFRRQYCDKDYWVNKLAERIENRKEHTVIADMRFINELDFCNRNGVTVKVDRGIIADTCKAHHQSETDLDTSNFDFYLDNKKDDPTHTVLFNQVDRMMKQLGFEKKGRS